jgi:phage tail protein X
MRQLFISHRTVAGERWDLLAWQYYGNPSLYGPIIMANPAIPIEPAFEPGLMVGIPIITSVTGAAVGLTTLPPWQR